MGNGGNGLGMGDVAGVVAAEGILSVGDDNAAAAALVVMLVLVLVECCRLFAHILGSLSSPCRRCA